MLLRISRRQSSAAAFAWRVFIEPQAYRNKFNKNTSGRNGRAETEKREWQSDGFNQIIHHNIHTHQYNIYLQMHTVVQLRSKGRRKSCVRIRICALRPLLRPFIVLLQQQQIEGTEEMNSTKVARSGCLAITAHRPYVLSLFSCS